MDKILNSFKNTQYADVYQPFEEMIDLPDEEFDKFYPTFKKDLEKLLASPEMENVIMNAVKTTPNIDVQKEKEALDAFLKEIEADDDLSANKKEMLKLIFGTTLSRGFDYVENPREKINVKVVKMYDDVQIPSYAHPEDAGADIYSYDDVVIEGGETKLIHTGLKFGIPAGYEIQIRPRSGNSLKTKIRIANTPATIDSSFTGEVGIIVDNIGSEPIHIEKGFKIAQILIKPVPMMIFEETDELASTARGEDGFGSTDNKS